MYVPERMAFAMTPKQAGGVRVNPNSGKIKEFLFGAPTKTSFVTTIVEKNDKLYFSSLRSPTIVIIDKNRLKKTENKDSGNSNEL